MGEVVCVEGTERDTEVLALIESRICDIDYIPELNATNYITDSNSTEVKTGHLYKDKGTLVAVMTKYKIKNNFNFRVKRLDKKRPVNVVDAAHLGGAYKGTFVSASTLDGAGCILPLAYGVVDTENDCSWTWFFEHFKNAFGERENMCIVSDRNECIIKSVSIVYPNVPHCACIWHFWKNVCSSFKRSKNTLSDIFYSMTKAYRKENFDKLMAKVVTVDHRVKDYLEGAGYEKWSRVHSTITEVVPSSEYIFTVHEAEKRYIVCLERKTCTCGRFQHDEIPCAHAIAVLKHKNITNLHSHCSDYYKPYALEKTYKVVMVPMPDKEDWNVPEYVLDEIVRPPRYRRLAGRPRKQRNKNADEKITVNNNSCGQCGQEGHNRRTCTFFPKEN
nr:uncharacterized protein LOC112940993 [Solanum lycopersicum]